MTRRWLFLVAHGLVSGLTALVFLLTVVPYSRLRRLLQPRRRPNILWGPTPILTIETNAIGDRMRGLQSDTLVYDPYHLSHSFTCILTVASRPAWQRLLLPYAVFLWAAWRYDVFQFYYDRGLLNGRDRFTYHRMELPLLALAGKGTVVSGYGGDIRYRERATQEPPYSFCMACPQPGIICVCDAGKAKANYAHVARWASTCLSLGEIADYTPGGRTDVPYIGIDLSQVPFVGAAEQPGRPVRIVHAPNHRHFKGTHYLEQAVATLQAEGLSVELEMVEKLPNTEARKRYAAADIIADQFIGGYFGYFAVEGMALGKPVLCFVRDRYPALSDVACPVVNTSPETLVETLRALVLAPERRERLGKAGRTYVEAVFDLPALSRKMAEVYTAVWGHA